MRRSVHREALRQGAHGPDDEVVDDPVDTGGLPWVSTASRIAAYEPHDRGGTGSGPQPAEPGAPTRGRRPARRNDHGRAARILADGTACQVRPRWPSLTSRGGRRQPRGGRDRPHDRGAGVIAPFAPQVGVRSRPRGRPRRRRRAARPRPPRLGGCRSGQGCPRCSRRRRQRRCDASDRGGRPRAGGRRTR